MSLLEQGRQWLHRTSYWNYSSVAAEPASERSEGDEQEQSAIANSLVDTGISQSANLQIAIDGAGETNLGWADRAFRACASTCENVQQGIVKGIKAKPWSGVQIHTGVAGVMFLLMLLLLYQIGRSPSSPDVEIFEAVQETEFVRDLSFNCSELGLKDAMQSLPYHIYPSDPRLLQACQSKFEQHCLRKNTQGEFLPSPKFLELLRRYEAYHHNCTKDYDLTAMGIAGDTPPGCKYLVWKAMDGMGNQLLSLVCAFIYSLLTDRVMLIDPSSHMDSFLCNPFPFSSWVLPADFPETQLRLQAKRVFVYLDETLASLQRNSSCSTIPPADLPSFIAAAPKHLHAYIICCDNRRDHQFFCPTAQKLFSGSNWFFYLSHEYIIPGLYFVPEFRDKLNDWFPRQDAFMHGSRYLLNPENSLWERILQFYRAHMEGADRLIGIQPRTWSWDGNYNPSISEQIAMCAVEQKLLPATRNAKATRERKETGAEDGQGRHVDISVLVTSLRAEYGDNLAFQYANYANVEDLVVDVISPSSEGYQKTGDMEHDAKAIIDIWLLSFMHSLVITPRSTFGSTASGFAGIVPFVFRNYGGYSLGQPACTASNVVGPCFIVWPREQPCDLDPARASIFDPNEKVPEVKFCDYNVGLGVVTA